MKCAQALVGALICGALAGSGCGSDDLTALPPPQGPPTIERFYAEDTLLTHGDWTALRWSVPGATVASISPGVGHVAFPDAGKANVHPSEPTLYTLRVSNTFGADTARVAIEVIFRPGIYVDGIRGDDSLSGDTPRTAIRSLEEALARAREVGAVFLAVGDYPSVITIDGFNMEIRGGLNPDTFFEEPPASPFRSRVIPLSGAPLTVRNSSALVSNLVLRAPSDAHVGAELSDAGTPARPCVLEDCTIDGRMATGGTGMWISGDSHVVATRCRIQGSKRPAGSALAETRGVLIQDGANAFLTNCFIDGGRASRSSTGVDIVTSGSVGLGLNTVGAEITDAMFDVSAAAVRIHRRVPAATPIGIGGNILFALSRGPRPGFGISEEAPDANPSFLESNLFVTLGTAYRNFDGPDADTEEGLNWFANTIQTAVVPPWGNLLVESVSPQEMFRSVEAGDYHLVNPLASFDINPAIDRGVQLREEYGGSRIDLDIDRAGRPGFLDHYDRGADELD